MTSDSDKKRAAGSKKTSKKKAANKKAAAKKGKRSTKKTSSRRRGASADSLELGTDKLYFKIGEVSDIVGVAAHVLRYWETEFPIIKPQKSRSQQRVYRRKDVENLLRIKHLLYERKFTIAGAKQELRGGAGKVQPATVSGVYKARQSLARVREHLDLLAAAVRSDPGPGHLAADPSAFVREAGGAAGVRAQREGQESPAQSQPSQPLLDRPPRSPYGE
ncbi:transcriptional regulator, MerR family protein [Plesiocystis pacifica SIR-1]|uniref:Transcriptional regulator, MerR family protein n=1 Tax=Plesiocystis pacifica SIR-1 TaxID=391625 RepID=A6G4W3_9BACT|nr:MerR family transcriptional regulator [Plesiocystis pacifica]EDM79055.1 transcriptional regulator, MerR family protein [Plesiocystis pacifica SIR-1]